MRQTEEQDDNPLDNPVLKTAVRDLEDYCSIQAAAGEDANACLGVKDWLIQKWHSAVEPRLPSTSDSSPSPALDQLNKALRELGSAGDGVQSMYNSLRLMQRLEQRTLQQPGRGQQQGPAPASSTQPSGSLASAPATPAAARVAGLLPPGLSPQDKAALALLFQRLDTDGNGWLSWAEFNTAMHAIGDDLADDEVQLMGEALDLQGHVDLEQFLAIVEAAEARRATPHADSQYLIRLRHAGHH